MYCVDFLGFVVDVDFGVYCVVVWVGGDGDYVV